MTTPSTRQRLRETAERAKVDPDLMTAIDPSDLVDLLDHLDRMEAVVKAAVEWRKNERELDEHAMAGTEAPVHLRQADWQTIDEMRKAVDAYLAADRLTRPGAK